MFELKSEAIELIRDTSYKGRNGTAICKGVEVFTHPMPSTGGSGGKWDVCICPLNSKGLTDSCQITIPGEQTAHFTSLFPGNLGEVILDALPRKTFSVLLGIDPVLDAEIERRLKED